MNGGSASAVNGARSDYSDAYATTIDENQSPHLSHKPNSTRSRVSPRVTNTNGPLRKATGDYDKPLKALKPKGNSRVGSNGQNRAYKGMLPSNDSDEDIPENMWRPEKDEPEGWIHRDKLAKIESEELQAAGINLANRRSRSQRLQAEFSEEKAVDTPPEEKRQRIQSPVQEEEDLDRTAWDVRTPEEINSDQAASSMYSNPMLRKSGSKIPVLSSSPHPIPAERYDRDTPIARKRTASGTLSLESNDILVSKTRSPGSKILDDPDATSTTNSSKPSSPNKARSKSTTATPANGAARKATAATRKASVPSGTPGSPVNRPGSRAGEPERPRTAVNRPEGDPPWLATMYKPDPMLPPDQQLIPTLARKQQQAQWAEAGAVPTTYDRDFSPLAVHTEDGLVKAPSPSPPPPAKDNDGTNTTEPNSWPLRPIALAKDNSGRPGTSGSLTGGYSTMPKVTSPSLRTQSPKLGPSSISGGGQSKSAAQLPPSRMQEQNAQMDQDDTVKKGCGCCIVM